METLTARALWGENRADAIFALPSVPKTAVVLGDLPAWRSGLPRRGVEIVEGRGHTPDLAVAKDSTDLHNCRAPFIILEGFRGREGILRAAGYRTRHLLALPRRGEPAVLFDPRQRRAARYAIAGVLAHPELWRTIRGRLAAAMFGAGIRLPLGTGLTLGANTSGPPALIAAARELGLPPDREWMLLVAAGSAVRRDAFLLFPRGAWRPDLALKFARIPTRSADRDAQGLATVASAGGSVTARAPRYLGGLDVNGFAASLETAAVGSKLSAVLRRPGTRAAKLKLIQPVVEWLIQVGRETASPPDSLEPERRRLRDVVLPYWGVPGGSLVDGLEGIPGTFQHGDLAGEHVVVDGPGFTVLDWERASAHSFPLTDLTVLATDTLRILDGALREEERIPHLRALFTGRAPSSPILFRWLRDMSRALALPTESVGGLVTVAWLDLGRLEAMERHRIASLTGEKLGRPNKERAARAWLSDPALGLLWEGWRRSRPA
jgi:hypothetical protein